MFFFIYMYKRCTACVQKIEKRCTSMRHAEDVLRCTGVRAAPRRRPPTALPCRRHRYDYDRYGMRGPARAKGASQVVRCSNRCTKDLRHKKMKKMPCQPIDKRAKDVQKQRKRYLKRCLPAFHVPFSVAISGRVRLYPPVRSILKRCEQKIYAVRLYTMPCRAAASSKNTDVYQNICRRRSISRRAMYSKRRCTTHATCTPRPTPAPSPSPDATPSHAR